MQLEVFCKARVLMTNNTDWRSFSAGVAGQPRRHSGELC